MFYLRNYCRLVLVLLLSVAIANAGIIQGRRDGGDDFTSIDFTDFTETDTPGWISVDDADTITITDMDRNSSAYTYDDYTAGYFDEDFTHRFELTCSGSTDAWNVAGSWGLANSTNGYGNWTDGTRISCNYHPTSDYYYIAFEVYVDGAYSVGDGTWDENAITASTKYYITVTRDDDAGANSTGQYTVYIRTGSHSGSLHDTLSADVVAGEQNDYRYLYGAVSDGGSGSGYSIDAVVETMEIKDSL